MTNPKIDSNYWTGFSINESNHLYLGTGITKEYSDLDFFQSTTTKIIVREVEIVNDNMSYRNGEICYLIEIFKDLKNTDRFSQKKRYTKKIKYLERGGKLLKEKVPNQQRFPKEVRKILEIYKKEILEERGFLYD